jgi:hypothetical protein
LNLAVHDALLVVARSRIGIYNATPGLRVALRLRELAEAEGFR